MRMPDRDEWGRDPSVQGMRKVFKAMETAQQELLERLDIQPYDLRIRRWRGKALALFERAWGIANQLGIAMDTATASAVYCSLLARIMGAEGIEVPEGLVPAGEEAARLIKEVFA
ncbi:MAG: hypothetical protein A2Y65_02760 [Deltaproteobacteria bacterium RBG_13_52_11]|nr:MAG: hypothetical protein A2Y65_02760 [Deltaproteobacteria bacterium RBG_13_52_11]